MAVGAVSLAVLPTTPLPWASLRVLNLVLAPAGSAYLAYTFARRRVKAAGAGATPRLRATYAACFTFGLAVVRFVFAGQVGDGAV